MATYDGETVRITATVTDFDGNTISPTIITNATVSLYDTSGNYAFQNQSLTYDTTTLYWYYDWQDALPGTWTAQCTFQGATFEVFNYGTVRVRPLKVIPTGQPTTIVN